MILLVYLKTDPLVGFKPRICRFRGSLAATLPGHGRSADTFSTKFVKDLVIFAAVLSPLDSNYGFFFLLETSPRWFYATSRVDWIINSLCRTSLSFLDGEFSVFEIMEIQVDQCWTFAKTLADDGTAWVCGWLGPKFESRFILAVIFWNAEVSWTNGWKCLKICLYRKNWNLWMFPSG